MKFAAAQISSSAGDWEANINKHIIFIERAAAQGADLIVFPELSLTGYEPTLAKALARSTVDPIFNPLTKAAAENNVTVCAGAPIRGQILARIGMLIFYPDGNRGTYYKQLLHEDELPFFEAGTEQSVIKIGDNRLIPAICYESMQLQHLRNALALRPSTYLASVSKSSSGMKQAHEYFSDVSASQSLHVCLVNAVGNNDNFVAAGMSACWNNEGALLGKLDDKQEGILTVVLP